MRTGLHDPSAVHDENAVRILHGGDTLGDDDLCGIRKLILKCLTDQGIGVFVSTAEVESSRIRIFGSLKSSRNTETLLLAAGDVRSSLLDVVVS